MNRQRLVANLIYLILTYVQGSLWQSMALASPNLEPTPTTDNTSIQTTSDDESATLGSLSISEPTAQTKPYSMNNWSSQIHDRISFSAGLFSGPYQEEKIKTLYPLGFDFAVPINPSEKVHLGLMLTKSPNPIIYASRESYLRNYWLYLKSWSYLLRLEIDSLQGLGSLISLNHYMAGAGLSFSLTSNLDLLVNLYPLSSRGPGGEIKLSFLVF